MSLDQKKPPTPPEKASDSPTSVADESTEVGLEAVATTPSETDELEALRIERNDLADQLLRKRAEFENYRKRIERVRQQIASDAQADLLAGLVSTLDNLEHALRSDTTDGSLRSGLELIQRDLMTYLGKQGLVTHDPTGQPFDPLLDQALLHEHVPGYDEGIVVECLRKGYLFRERLLRPALVKVARSSEKAPEGETDRSNDETQSSDVTH